MLFRRIANAVARSTYLPLGRFYSRRFIRDKPADVIFTGFARFHFWRSHGYWPQLTPPRSFEEKITARMLFDRDPKWILFSDKVKVRDYVADKIGEQILIPLLWVGRSPSEIPFDELPPRFVIKTNHGCAYTIIVQDKSQLQIAPVLQQLEKWLAENFCHDYVLGTAWAYRNISPTVMIESFLDDDGNVPSDYKFFCFGGRVEVFKLDFDRFTDHSVRFFDRRCQPVEVHEVGLKRYGGNVILPANMDEMIAVAERLAEGLDFIRVDLYNVKGRIFFGELTCYPGGGDGPWDPESFDFALGQKLKLAP